VDDAVAQAGVRLLLLDQGVGVDDPVHGAVADGMGADRDAGLVEEAHHFWRYTSGSVAGSRDCPRPNS
jgi:hypothetical protein